MVSQAQLSPDTFRNDFPGATPREPSEAPVGWALGHFGRNLFILIQWRKTHEPYPGTLPVPSGGTEAVILSNSKIIALVVAVVVVVAAVGAYVALSGSGGGQPGGGPPDPGTPDDPGTDTGTYAGYSDWSYWLGDVARPGVSDAKTPITEEDMTELWRIEGQVSSSSMAWRVPGTPICVGDHTYYYSSSDNTIYKLVTRTGDVVASQYCPSSVMYNTPLAYGDGKVFAPLYVDNQTVMYAFDADTLEVLFHSEPVSGGQVEGAITYHDGYVFFGTYDGDYACFSSEDTDTSRGDETVGAVWILESDGWYNSVPAFFGDYCVIADKGYDSEPLGATVYSVEYSTGAVVSSIQMDMEYCVSSAVAYEGRAYIAFGATTDKQNATGTSADLKTVTIHSYEVGADGVIDTGSIRTWQSENTSSSGTQSIPVIWNDRIYIGGGGGVLMGSGDQEFTVIQIGEDDEMSTAYVVDGLRTKGTATITTAYATDGNDYAVYIYIMEYGEVLPGEAADSMVGSADFYCLRDSQDQTSEEIVFHFTPSVQQFSYLSAVISYGGCVLVKNDSTLFCYGFAGGDAYGPEDLVAEIDRILADSRAGTVNPSDVASAEGRYAAMSESDRALVTNYSQLQDLYVDVTFVCEGQESTVRVVSGSTVSVPGLTPGGDRVITGWVTSDGTIWRFQSDRVISDTIITATVSDTVEVSFDTSGGSSVDPVRVVAGGVVGYVPDPEREGHVFGGWYSGSIEVTPMFSTVGSDTTLTARWLTTSTIEFDSAGGSSVPSIPVTYTMEVGDLPIPTRSGYTFDGWYLGDQRYTTDTVYPYEHGVTLTAHWVENSPVTLSKGGFSVSGAFTEGAELTVQHIRFTSAPVTAIYEAAGTTDLDVFSMVVESEGLSDTGSFTLSLDVGPAFNEEELTVYVYTSGVTAYTSTVSGGILTLDIPAVVYSDRMDITMGIATGTELPGSL